MEKSDYLKYWKIVRRYIILKHNISPANLDLLLFLNSEQYFGIDTFQRYEAIISWNPDRISKLQKEGWVKKFRDFDKSLNEKTLYVLTLKAKTMIRSIYDILEHKKTMSERMPKTTTKRYKSGFLHKKHLEFIIKINEETKRLQHLSPE